MVLQKQNIDIPIGGLNTKSDPNLVPPGQMLEVVNAEYTKAGALKKREAFVSMSATSNTVQTPSQGSAPVGGMVASFGNKLFAAMQQADSSGGVSLSDMAAFYRNSSSDKWSALGTYVPLGIETLRAGGTMPSLLGTNASYNEGSAVAVGNDFICNIAALHYSPNTNISLRMTDKETGALVHETYLGTRKATVFHFTNSGNPVFSVLQQVTNGIDLLYNAENNALPFENAGQIFASAAYSAGWEACKVDESYFAVVASAGSSNVIRKYSPASATHVWTTTITVTASAKAIFMVGSNLIFAYQDAADNHVKYYVISATNGSTIHGPLQVTSSAPPVSGVRHITACLTDEASNSLRFFWEVGDYSDTQFHKVETRRAVLSTGGTGDTKTIEQHGLAAHAFQICGMAYVWLIHHSELQPTYFLFCLGRVYDGHAVSTALYPVCVGKALYARAAGLCVSTLPFLDELDGSPVLPAFRLDASGSDGAIHISPVNVITTVPRESGDTHMGANPTAVHIDDAGLVGGARAVLIDGAIRGVGFDLYPEGVTLSAGSGSMSDGTYSVRVVYEARTAAGEILRSAPSPAVSITLSGGTNAQGINVEIPTFPCAWGGMQISNELLYPSVRAVVYRTENGGSTYYECANANALVTAMSFGLGTDTVIADCEENDADIADNRALYTTGGVLEEGAPPPFLAVAKLGTRVFVAASDEDGVVYCSKKKEPGLAVAFSPLLTVPVDVGGKIKALAPLGDACIVFGENVLRAIVGDGPNAMGFGDFGVQDIDASIGCVDHRSVVTTKDGIFFKAPSGFYLLDRSLQLQYIGAGIEAYGSESVVAACHVPDKWQVRFFLLNSILVYDYNAGSWSVFRFDDINDMAVVAGAAYWPGQGCVIMSVRAGVFLQTPGDYTGIKMDVTFPWIKLGGIAGFQRLYGIGLLARHYTSAQMSCNLSLDYFDEAHEQFTIDLTAPGNEGDPVIARHHSGEKCSAFRLGLEESTESPGRGVEITGLTIVAGVKGGINKRNRTEV